MVESNDVSEEEESYSNAHADYTEQNDGQPSRKSSRTVSYNQINREEPDKNLRSSKNRRSNRTEQEVTLIGQMMAIDERYSIERSKVMKKHEAALRKKLEELDSKRLNEIKCLLKRVDKSVDKDADLEASDENPKLHEASPSRNSSKSIQNPEESEQIRVQSSNSSLQQSVPNNITSAVTSNTPDRSPLQETVDIAAAASQMASIVSEKEGVDLNNFQPGKAKKKKIAFKKKNKNTDHSSLSGDVDLSTNTKYVLGQSNSSEPPKAITNQKKVSFAQVLEKLDTTNPTEAVTDVEEHLPTAVHITMNSSNNSNDNLEAANPSASLIEERLDGSVNSVEDALDAPRPSSVEEECLQAQNITPEVLNQETPHLSGMKSSLDEAASNLSLSEVVKEVSNAVLDQSDVSVIQDADSRKDVHFTSDALKSDCLISKDSVVKDIEEMPKDSAQLTEQNAEVSAMVQETSFNKDNISKNGSEDMVEPDVLASTLKQTEPAPHVSLNASTVGVSTNVDQVSKSVEMPASNVANKPVEVGASLDPKLTPVKKRVLKFVVKNHKETVVPTLETSAPSLPISTVKSKSDVKVAADNIDISNALQSKDKLIESLPIAPTRGVGLAKLTAGQKMIEPNIMNPGKEQPERQNRGFPSTQDLQEVLIENVKQSEVVAALESQSSPPESLQDSQKCTLEDEHKLEDGGNADKKSDYPGNNDEASSSGTEDDERITIDSEDTLSTPMTIDIPPLNEPIPGGESFMHAGSVNTTNKSRPQRFQKKDETAEGISELVLKNKILPSAKVNKVYDDHVMRNKFNAIRLTRKDQRNSDGGTKIRIGPSSVTEREFVQALRPLGKLCLNMIWN